MNDIKQGRGNFTDKEEGICRILIAINQHYYDGKMGNDKSVSSSIIRDSFSKIGCTYDEYSKALDMIMFPTKYYKTLEDMEEEYNDIS